MYSFVYVSIRLSEIDFGERTFHWTDFLVNAVVYHFERCLNVSIKEDLTGLVEHGTQRDWKRRMSEHKMEKNNRTYYIQQIDKYSNEDTINDLNV